MPNAIRRLAPEWAPQDAVMLTWPHDETSWAPYLADVEQVYLELAAAIARFQSLLIVCRDEKHISHVQGKFRIHKIGNARFIAAASNDTWARDHGPICVYENNSPLLLDFEFNGWGGKYPSTLDNAINDKLSRAHCFRSDMRHVDFILEGGAIDTDGKGTILTTSQCLMSPSRNGGLTRARIENTLHEWLGSNRILWLNHGALEGDDTDGHIDTLARFCDPQTIAFVACNDPADSQYEELSRMAEELHSFRQDNGQPYRLIPLPSPRIHRDSHGERLPATYANFLIINGAVLVPTYRDTEHDEEAMEKLAEAFPGREITGIDCVPLIHQYGSLHCITMQLPAGTLTNLST